MIETLYTGPYARQLEWLRLPHQLTSPNPFIILDSGAYNIWRSGGGIDYDKYARYCNTIGDQTLTCVNLDLIPGAWGKHVTSAQVEEACQVSYERWLALTKAAPNTLMMPVYHQGDDPMWLSRYLDKGAVYIGISPTDAYSTPVRQEWLHRVHEDIGRSGHKLNKDVFTHCLGVFAPKILHNLPAWSADASTINRWTSWKRLLLPKIERKGIVGFKFVSVSSRAPRGERVDWAQIAAYLKGEPKKPETAIVSEGTPVSRWCDLTNPPPLVIEDAFELAHLNLAIAHRTTKDTGVRCFVAGSDRPFKYAIEVRERYPYILTSYAQIKEETGATIQRIYNRATPCPIRRPERDRKVETARGLFPQ